MKNLIIAALSFVAAGVFANSAHATQAPLWTCDLTFKASGSEFQIFIGHSKLTGTGMIRCIDIHGQRTNIPVDIKIRTPFLAPRVAIVPIEKVFGFASGIGIATNPTAILGDYLAADVRAAIGVGGSAGLALHGLHNALTLDVSLMGVEGLGIAAGFTHVTLTAAKPALN